MSKLTNRLRFAATRAQRCPSLQIEAADRIEEMEAEIDRLTRELAEAKARAVPDSKSVSAVLKEASQILSSVADENLNDLPANWRWPLIDELSGFAAMLSARPDPKEPTP